MHGAEVLGDANLRGNGREADDVKNIRNAPAWGTKRWIGHESRLEMLRCECPSGMRFQISFERCSSFLRVKGNGGIQAPWAVLHRVRTLPSIVGTNAPTEIRGQTCIVLPGVGYTAENVDIVIRDDASPYRVLAQRTFYQIFPKGT